MYRGFLEAFRNKNEESKKFFAQARAANPDIDRQYLGLQAATPAALLDLVSPVNFFWLPLPLQIHPAPAHFLRATIQNLCSTILEIIRRSRRESCLEGFLVL